jgi:phosphatidylserine decarboxylase
MIAKYARLDGALIAIVGGALSVTVAALFGWWALLPAALTLALLAFYRDPQRAVRDDPAVLLAPADGRVMFVQRSVPVAHDAPRTMRICIFLSVFDVHINRSPCAGRVADVHYRPGRFLNALKAEATDQNESNTLRLEPQPPLPGPLHVRQIAGVLARRIVCTVSAGDTLKAGERFGMIKFGSQTEIRAPEDERWELLVQTGDHVRAGTTVLARLRESTL